MKISLDPMTHLRYQAEAHIDGHFNTKSRMSSHKVQEYALKRQHAMHVVGGGTSELLEAEAKLTNISSLELAHIILGKEDELVKDTLARRKAILTIRAAQSQEEIDAVLAEFNIPALGTAL